MKIATWILLCLAFALIVYNATLLDFNNLLEGNSAVALIGILASICAIIILTIFVISKKIEKKLK